MASVLSMHYSWLDANDLTNEEKERFFAGLHKERFLWAKERGFDERALLSAVCDHIAKDLSQKFFDTVSPIKRDALGRPFFENSRLFVSHSHSGTLCISAVSGAPVGIDIEKIRDIDMRLAKRLCCENEAVNDINELLSLWTLKEAYLKLIGTGLHGGLKSVSFEFTKAGIICSDKSVKAQNILLPGFIGAVCWREE